MMIDYDPNDEGPLNKAEMLNSSGAMRTPVWSDVVVRSNPSEMSKDSHLFVRIPTRSIYRGNLRLTDSGTCFVATTEVPFEVGDVGEVWVDYDITFHVPSINRSEPLSQYGRGLGSDFGVLGNIQPENSETGSAVSWKTRNEGGNSIIEFLQDFTGTVLVDLSESSSDPPPLMSADTDELGGSTPALLGFLETVKDEIFGISKLAIGVVAQAGDSFRVKAVEDATWSLGPVVLRMLPYAKALMGVLAFASTFEQKVLVSLKANIREIGRAHV